MKLRRLIILEIKSFYYEIEILMIVTINYITILKQYNNYRNGYTDVNFRFKFTIRVYLLCEPKLDYRLKALGIKILVIFLKLIFPFYENVLFIIR